ncbi:MAG: heme exporter protein CcmD [Acidiferrobacterales bacterium]
MTLTEFISMGGYGFYVWASLGMTLLLIGAEVIYLKRQRVTNLQRIRRIKNINSGVKNET